MPGRVHETCRHTIPGRATKSSTSQSTIERGSSAVVTPPRSIAVRALPQARHPAGATGTSR